MPGSWNQSALPNLTTDNHTVQSPFTPRYNCIGWAAGSNVQWWWPVGRYYWPPHIPREETVEAFILAFGTLGYVACGDGSLEDDFEKIAIYAISAGGILSPTHAARQRPNGRWTSKLGPSEDIEHTTPENVNCPTYGVPVRYLKRPRKTSASVDRVFLLNTDDTVFEVHSVGIRTDPFVYARGLIERERKLSRPDRRCLIELKGGDKLILSADQVIAWSPAAGHSS